MSTMHKRKRGFSIIELVIVIAIIAILAAVLIPTFANVVDRANLSSDKVAVRNMNTALATYDSEGVEFSGRVDVYNALRDAGFATDGLKPVSAGHKFFYISEYNTMVLINEKDEVVFPEDEKIKAFYESNKAHCYDMTTNLPAATLKKMTEQEIIAENIQYPFGSETQQIILDTAVEFTAPKEGDTGEWDYWYVDFEISFNKNITEAIAGPNYQLYDDSVAFALAGSYANWGNGQWLPLVLSDQPYTSTGSEAYTVTKGTTILSVGTQKHVVGEMLSGADSSFSGFKNGVSYSMVKGTVESFKCGIYAVWSTGTDGINKVGMSDLQKEFLNGLTVTIQLKMYETKYDSEVAKDYVLTGKEYLISTYSHTWNV